MLYSPSFQYIASKSVKVVKAKSVKLLYVRARGNYGFYNC